MRLRGDSSIVYLFKLVLSMCDFLRPYSEASIPEKSCLRVFRSINIREVLLSGSSITDGCT